MHGVTFLASSQHRPYAHYPKRRQEDELGRARQADPHLPQKIDSAHIFLAAAWSPGYYHEYQALILSPSYPIASSRLLRPACRPPTCKDM
jgi:hypothetical protein